MALAPAHKDRKVSLLHSSIPSFAHMYFYGNNTAGMAINTQETVAPKAQDSLLSRCKASYRSKTRPTVAKAENASRTRRILDWMCRLHPRRWWHRRLVYMPSNSGPPVIPEIKGVGDRLFLESLIRHTEENVIFESRASTQPLLYHDSQPPPEFQFDAVSTPYQRQLFDDMFETSDLVGMPITEERLPALPSRPRENILSRRNNFLLLRAPHPPTSYPLSPPNINHSRQTSQSGSSIVSSSCDPAAYRISSISMSSVGDRSSSLFYRSPRSPTPDSRTTSLSPITPTKENCLPTYPIARAGSLTVSIRTEKGKEELEFPSPPLPPRWSGCWFSERANNQTPQPFQQEEEESVEDDGTETPALTTAQQSQLSLENSTGSGSLSPLPTPNVRTFGFGTASFFSLRAQAAVQPEGKSRLVPKPSDDDLGDADDEEMESVCSRFADVSMNSGATFDAIDDALSDTDSYADPSLRLY